MAEARKQGFFITSGNNRHILYKLLSVTILVSFLLYPVDSYAMVVLGDEGQFPFYMPENNSGGGVGANIPDPEGEPVNRRILIHDMGGPGSTDDLLHFIDSSSGPVTHIPNQGSDITQDDQTDIITIEEKSETTDSAEEINQLSHKPSAADFYEFPMLALLDTSF